MEIPLFSISQIRMLEENAVTKQQISEYTLMERAGTAALDYLLANWPEAQKILVVCGFGNNGGDGYVLANAASRKGLQVTICSLGHPEQFSTYTVKAFNACQSSPIEQIPFNEQTAASWLRQEYDVIVDALFGIGLKREITGVFHQVITALNRSGTPILSLDVPSGIDAETGVVLGVAVQAQMTVTFIALKKGLLTGEALDYCGKIMLADLAVTIPTELTDSADWLLNSTLLSHHLHRRMRYSHKGDYGHVLVIGGNHGMAGAARLAAEAALRTGAGMVSVATLPCHQAVINAMQPEIMCHSITATEDLFPLLARATVLVLGPGLGQDEWARQVFACAIQNVQLPIVIDADGLNLLGALPNCQDNWVLTPHSGEAARLLAVKSSKEVEHDRFAAISKLAALGGHWILKGAGSLTKTQNQSTYLCPYGNSGMASGGMGDALSGIIGGMIAQKVAPFMATKLGVLTHALAGDLAAEQGERGLVATDLIDKIRMVVNT